MGVRVLVCDLDGVLRTFDRSCEADVEARHRLPPGVIAAAAFDEALLAPAVTGTATDE